MQLVRIAALVFCVVVIGGCGGGGGGGGNGSGGGGSGTPNNCVIGESELGNCQLEAN